MINRATRKAFDLHKIGSRGQKKNATTVVLYRALLLLYNTRYIVPTVCCIWLHVSSKSSANSQYKQSMDKVTSFAGSAFCHQQSDNVAQTAALHAPSDVFLNACGATWTNSGTRRLRAQWTGVMVPLPSSSSTCILQSMCTYEWLGYFVCFGCISSPTKMRRNYFRSSCCVRSRTAGSHEPRLSGQIDVGLIRYTWTQQWEALSIVLAICFPGHEVTPIIIDCFFQIYLQQTVSTVVVVHVPASKCADCNLTSRTVVHARTRIVHQIKHQYYCTVLVEFYYNTPCS